MGALVLKLTELQLALSEELDAGWSLFVLGRCYAALYDLAENAVDAQLREELERLRDLCVPPKKKEEAVNTRLTVRDALASALNKYKAEA